MNLPNKITVIFKKVWIPDPVSQGALFRVMSICTMDLCRLTLTPAPSHVWMGSLGHKKRWERIPPL